MTVHSILQSLPRYYLKCLRFNYLIQIVARSKSKRYKPQKVKKLALNSQLQMVQILANNVQMLSLCISSVYYYCNLLHKGLTSLTILFVCLSAITSKITQKSRTLGQDWGVKNDPKSQTLVMDQSPSKIFDQVGHETMYAYSGDKHFFTKSCHRQTYQNYEQS